MFNHLISSVTIASLIFLFDISPVYAQGFDPASFQSADNSGSIDVRDLDEVTPSGLGGNTVPTFGGGGFGGGGTGTGGSGNDNDTGNSTGAVLGSATLQGDLTVGTNDSITGIVEITDPVVPGTIGVTVDPNFTVDPSFGQNPGDTGNTGTIPTNSNECDGNTNTHSVACDVNVENNVDSSLVNIEPLTAVDTSNNGDEESVEATLDSENFKEANDILGKISDPTSQEGSSSSSHSEGSSSSSGESHH